MSQNVTISHPICPNCTASPSPVFCGTGVYMCSLNGNASTLRGTADLNLPVDKLYDLHWHNSGTALVESRIPPPQNRIHKRFFLNVDGRAKRI